MTPPRPIRRALPVSLLALAVAVAPTLAACQSAPPPMHPGFDHSEPPPMADKAPQPPPSAWPEAVPVPEKALEACSGRGAGESCWLYESDVGRNGDCVALPADAGQIACWTASAR